MPRNDAHERAFIEAFIRPEIRERYTTLLAHPKRRARELPLEDALEATEGQQNATVISCLPGRLGFLECEALRYRFLLVR